MSGGRDSYDTALAHMFAGWNLYDFALAPHTTANIGYRLYDLYDLHDLDRDLSAVCNLSRSARQRKSKAGNRHVASRESTV